jgi:hypothetical protein
MVEPYDLNAIIGDTLRWNASFTNSAGNSYNLTGSTLSLQVRNGYYPSKIFVTYTFGVTSGSTLSQANGIVGGISTTASGGVANICIGSTYTNQFPPYTNVFYDLQASNASNGDTITLARGAIKPIPNVTT